MTGPQDADRLSAAALSAGDPTGWFEPLYAEAAQGAATVPWDRPEANPMLVDWAQGVSGVGRRALIVGCGLGRDADFVAGLGFATTAFDISPTAVRTAQQRHPGSVVDYRVANLLDLPSDWVRAYDLVVESYTVQALPRSLRPQATAAVGVSLAPGGTLLVLASKAGSGDDDSGPPWRLTRPDLDLFAVDGVSLASVVELPPATGGLPVDRWRAVFTR